MNSLSIATAPRRGLSPLILACLASTWLIWGSTYLAIRFALAGFPPFLLMATRFLCAGAMLLAWQLARGARMPNLREWRNAALIGALMLGCGMGGTAYAEQTIPSGIVVAFIAGLPLLLVLINLVFRVFPKRSELLAVIVGFAGVLMLTRGQSMQASSAGLTALAIAEICWALGSILSQRGFSLAPGATGFASEMLCGGAVLLGVSYASGESWQWTSNIGAWAAWAYLVVFGSLIAFNAYMLLLAKTSTSVASSYSFVNPVVALILGVSIGAEIVTGWEWLAAGVVMLGVVLLFIGRRRST